MRSWMGWVPGMGSVLQQRVREAGSNTGLWMMQALSSSLDYKTVDKNYVAEKWTTGIDTEQEQMLPGNRGVDKLPTRRRYLFSWAKLALDSAHNRSVQNQICHKFWSLTVLIDYYNSLLSKLLNSTVYRILLFRCCSGIMQTGRVNYCTQQQRRIALSASLWLKLCWITTVGCQ